MEGNIAGVDYEGGGGVPCQEGGKVRWRLVLLFSAR